MDDLKRLVEKMDEKLDKLDQRLDNVDVTLVKQAADLEHHIFRTGLAEKRIEMLQSDLTPVKKHVYIMNGVFRITGMVVAGLSLIIGILKLAIDII